MAAEEAHEEGEEAMTTDRKAEGATGGRWCHFGCMVCRAPFVNGLVNNVGAMSEADAPIIVDLLNRGERAPTEVSLRALREAYEAGRVNAIPGDRTALYEAIRAVLSSSAAEPEKAEAKTKMSDAESGPSMTGSAPLASRVAGSPVRREPAFSSRQYGIRRNCMPAEPSPPEPPEPGKAEAKAEADVDEFTIPNLVAFVQRLARKLRQYDPESKTASQALDFLERKRLRGSILREDSPSHPEPQGAPERLVLAVYKSGNIDLWSHNADAADAEPIDYVRADLVKKRDDFLLKLDRALKLPDYTSYDETLEAVAALEAKLAEAEERDIAESKELRGILADKVGENVFDAARRVVRELADVRAKLADMTAEFTEARNDARDASAGRRAMKAERDEARAKLARYEAEIAILRRGLSDIANEQDWVKIDEAVDLVSRKTKERARRAFVEAAAPEPPKPAAAGEESQR